MSTNLRLNITSVEPGDRLVVATGLAPAWLGPFVRAVEPERIGGVPATVLHTVNGGRKVYPNGATVEVVRGQEPTGDPGEGY